MAPSEAAGGTPSRRGRGSAAPVPPESPLEAALRQLAELQTQVAGLQAARVTPPVRAPAATPLQHPPVLGAAFLSGASSVLATPPSTSTAAGPSGLELVPSTSALPPPAAPSGPFVPILMKVPAQIKTQIEAHAFVSFHELGHIKVKDKEDPPPLSFTKWSELFCIFMAAYTHFHPDSTLGLCSYGHTIAGLAASSGNAFFYYDLEFRQLKANHAAFPHLPQIPWESDRIPSIWDAACRRAPVAQRRPIAERGWPVWGSATTSTRPAALAPTANSATAAPAALEATPSSSARHLAPPLPPRRVHVARRLCLPLHGENAPESSPDSQPRSV